MKFLKVLSLSLLFFACSNSSSNQIHYNALLIDTHNDISSAGVVDGVHLEDDLSGKFHTDLNRFQKGGVDIQVFSIWMSGDYGTGTAYAYASRQIDSLQKMVKRNQNRVQTVSNVDEIEQAYKAKKLGVMFGVEGGHVIEDRLDYLDSLQQKGVRYMTLTWNNSTSWAISAADETDTTKTLPFSGLTPFGKEVIHKMNDLGIIVDISHVGESTFYDALETSTKPVIASHSAVYSLCPVPRNLKDEQLLAIKKNNGVVFINFYSGFLDKDYQIKVDSFLAKHSSEYVSLIQSGLSTNAAKDQLLIKHVEDAKAVQAPFSVLIDHIEYIIKLIGVEHVGLGSDYDGIESTPQEMDDVSTYPAITKELLNRGYSESDIKKILGENFIRVLKANE